MNAIEILQDAGFTPSQLEGLEILPDPRVPGCFLVLCPTIETAMIVYTDQSPCHDLRGEFETVDSYVEAMEYMARNRLS
jgi:hypothetical protein